MSPKVPVRASITCRVKVLCDYPIGIPGGSGAPCSNVPTFVLVAVPYAERTGHKLLTYIDRVLKGMKIKAFNGYWEIDQYDC